MQVRKKIPIPKNTETSASDNEDDLFKPRRLPGESIMKCSHENRTQRTIL